MKKVSRCKNKIQLKSLKNTDSTEKSLKDNLKRYKRKYYSHGIRTRSYKKGDKRKVLGNSTFSKIKISIGRLKVEKNSITRAKRQRDSRET